MKVFIDGDAGTTGLLVRQRLAGRDDLELIGLPETTRKDADARRSALESCDVAILCLPDGPAREAASSSSCADRPRRRLSAARPARWRVCPQGRPRT